MESSGVIILFIIGLLIIIFVFVAFSWNSDDNLQGNEEDDSSALELDSLIEERRLEHKVRLGELINKYGLMTTDIPLLVREGHDLIRTDSYMYVFEDSQMLVLAGESIPFSKIVSYTLADDYHTHSLQV